jgi:hypothetical protein
MQRFAREHDCVVRCEPIVTDGTEGAEQVGTAVQFFWDLRPGAAKPRRFRDVHDNYEGGSGELEWGPQARLEYANFPFE